MKNISLLLVFLCIGFVSRSQTITIRDSESHKAIELATLFSESPRAFATTNSKGQASLSAFRDADRIEIRTLGYRTVVKSFSELESQAFHVFLEVSNINLEEIVVSATRWRQSTDNVPARVISISPRELELQNLQTAADLLGISGKVFIQKSQQGGGSPMIRGFATNRLLYTLDGIRMNTAIFRGGNIQNVINLDPFAMENTEVLFGPGSVIYGSDAIGGVMSFQTLTPKLAVNGQPLITGKAVTRYSSANNEKTGHFDINIGWDKWAVLTSFSSWDYDHLRQGSHGPEDYIKDYYVKRQDSLDRIISQDDPLLQIPSAYSQINLMQKVRFTPGDEWDFQYGFHYSETSPYGRYDRHNRVRNGTARYAEWNYGPQKWMMNKLSLDHRAGKAAYDQMTLSLAQQLFEESRIDRSLNSNSRSIRSEKVMAYSLNLDFVKSTGKKNTAFYGLEYLVNDVTSTGMDENISTGASIPGPARYPRSAWSSIAAYINNEYRLSQKITLQAGLRYNHFFLDAEFDNTFYPFPFTTVSFNDGALTGSLGGVYRPSESWVISANFGTAFRSPNVDDMGKIFDSEQGSVVVPNPGLQAEYAYNFDLGLAKVFDDAVKIDLTGYYTILNDALVRRDFQLNGQDSIMYDGVMSKVQALQNAALARVYGIQAGLEVKLPAGFSFSSDMNFQKGEEELDDGSTSPSRHAAPFFGISRLNYKARGLHIKFYAEYQGERKHEEMPEEEKGKDEIYARDASGNTYAPAWYTLNIKAIYELTDIFAISAGVENITDRRYRPYSSGISAPGRNFIISMRANF
ncbi:MAG: TonB-dependent receptor [Bacteroidales bacterium]|nr:TonB-dependent receptor [Bacteroidales bacterium]